MNNRAFGSLEGARQAENDSGKRGKASQNTIATHSWRRKRRLCQRSLHDDYDACRGLCESLSIRGFDNLLVQCVAPVTSQ